LRKIVANTIGRGFHIGILAQDARTHIDEVHVGSIALHVLLLWDGPSEQDR